jgi:hypothetical protein
MKQEHLFMRRTERIFFLIVLLALSAFAVQAQDKQTVAPEEALQYHLQVRTVCGKVAGTQYAGKIKGQPTLLHIGKPYPEHVFTIVIWGDDRGKFAGAPEDLYRGKEVCDRGLIVEHRGKPQIVAKDPSQISVR